MTGPNARGGDNRMGGAVELVALCKRHGDTIAVDGIDLRVAAGEFFALLGPSGCGKTTTLRMIGGFDAPTSGRILLDGWTWRARRRTSDRSTRCSRATRSSHI
jgi:ABC-type Fe3+/spermidine/putrescine transport system ATPase subunit